MLVNLKTYRENKEIVKSLSKVDNFFKRTFPDKSWGWVAITALMFSQLAMEVYLKESNPRKGFYSAIRSMLLGFQESLNNCEKQQRKGNK